MMEEYERLASDLLEWIKQKRPWLENRATDNTLDGTQAKLGEFGIIVVRKNHRNYHKKPNLKQILILFKHVFDYPIDQFLHQRKAN